MIFEMSNIISLSNLIQNFKINNSAIKMDNLGIKMDNLGMKMKLQMILGSSSHKITQISCTKQLLIYICGCHIIFYDPLSDQQIGFINHRSSNISCISTLPASNLLAVAQSGKYPLISIYQMPTILCSQFTSSPLYQLKGHKHSIDLITFSNNQKYLVSISNNDGSMFIWQDRELITKNKVSKGISKVLFDWNQDLITIGNGYLKLWNFRNGNIIIRKQADTTMIEGKLLNFGKNFTTKDYIDVAIFYNKDQPNNQKLILLSSQGFLCTISHNYQKIQKWIDLMMPVCTSLKINYNLALCSGQNSLIKIIDLVSLSLRGKFPKPPPLNKQNISKQTSLHFSQSQKYPLCLGLLIFNQYILTLYQNYSMFLWIMEDQVKAVRSILTHKDRINSVMMLEEICGEICFFGTASQDNTLRLWHFYHKCIGNNKESIDIAQLVGIKRNAYCKNLTQIIYTHSEYPIVQIRIFMKKYIVCISKQQMLMYSLENFQLILHQSFREQFKSILNNSLEIILSLQVSQDLIYLGFQNGYLRIYKPSQQSLLKLREIQICFVPILELRILQNNKILCQTQRILYLYDLTSHTFTSFNLVNHSFCTSKYIFLCQQKKVIYFSLLKNKKISQVSFIHQLQQDQRLTIIRANKQTIGLITNKNRLLICSYNATILYSEMIHQQITDFQITKLGQFIFTNSDGGVVIKAVSSNYKKIEQRAKKWFQLNDMSWMDNSVWTHSKNQSHSTIKKAQSQFKIDLSSNLQPLSNIDRARSIHFQNVLDDESIKIGNKQVSSVQYQYKNQQNKMSVFNPANIYKQANQIYNNVNGLMKNIGGKNEPKMFDFSGDLDDISLSRSNNVVGRKKIFKPQQSVHLIPKFSNNLIQSKYSKVNQYAIRQQKVQPSTQINQPNTFTSNSSKSQPNQTLLYSVNLTQFKQENVNNSLKVSTSRINDKQKDQEIVYTIKEIIQQTKNQNGDIQYINSLIGHHYQDFRNVYILLHTIYGKSQQTKYNRQNANRNLQITNKNQPIANKNQQILNQNQQITNKNQIAKKNQQIARKNLQKSVLINQFKKMSQQYLNLLNKTL